MTHSDRILEFVRTFPGRDDDQISSALDIKPRQTVNQICRSLVVAGKIERRPNLAGKIENFLTRLVFSEPLASLHDLQKHEIAPLAALDATQEWFWEGNVTAVVSQYLIDQGWKILSMADTQTRERGIDIHAVQGNRELAVEVKGYPSRSYRDLKRANQPKPTSPTLQAQHWYSHALLKALRLQTGYPTAIIALAFPDFPRYRSLFAETANACHRLGIAVLFVSGTGQIEAIGL